MLRDAIESIGHKLKQNAISAFKSTGIHPLEPQQVLKRLPGSNSAGGSAPEDWTKVLVSHLKSLRRESPNQAKRGRRVCLEAGSVVSSQDLKRLQLGEKVRPKKSAREVPTIESIELEAGTSRGHECQVEEGDLVLCRYETETDRRTRHSVGRVTDIDGHKFEIKSLRSKLGSKQDYFFYPEIPDVVTLRRENIVRKLHCVLQRRGRMSFRNLDPRKEIL